MVVCSFLAWNGLCASFLPIRKEEEDGKGGKGLKIGPIFSWAARERRNGIGREGAKENFRRSENGLEEEREKGEGRPGSKGPKDLLRRHHKRRLRQPPKTLLLCMAISSQLSTIVFALRVVPYFAVP